MTEILVTGGTGFVGARLVERLVESGRTVRVLDSNFRGTPARLAAVRDRIELIEGDVRDAAAVRRATEGVSTVFHLAWINGTGYFYSEPRLVLEVGVKGTLNVLDAAADLGVSEMIFASSSEVYQTPPVIPTPETVPLVVPDPRNPRCSYGGGKLLGELLMNFYASEKMRRVTFRPHNVYGPAMGWEHVVPQLLEKLWVASDGLRRREATITLQGSGDETRAFCFVDDAVDGILACARAGADGEVYHVGVEEETAIARLAALLGEALGLAVSVRPSAPAAGGTLRRCPDTRKLRALGWAPRIALGDGIARTVAWYRTRLAERTR
jgi:nucleoside-diphosphate-sugar epimerase